MDEMKPTVTVPFGVGGYMLKAVQIALFHEQYPTKYKHMAEDNDYYELVKGLWEKGDPFIINEHDIIPWPGAIRQIDDCDQPWCTFWYRSPAGWLRNGLGLVKFNPAQLPNIFGEPFEKMHWANLDMQIAKRLQAHGLEAHTHSPSVTNLNPSMFLVSARISPPIPNMRTTNEDPQPKLREWWLSPNESNVYDSQEKALSSTVALEPPIHVQEVIVK